MHWINVLSILNQRHLYDLYHEESIYQSIKYALCDAPYFKTKIYKDVYDFGTVKYGSYTWLICKGLEEIPIRFIVDEDQEIQEISIVWEF